MTTLTLEAPGAAPVPSIAPRDERYNARLVHRLDDTDTLARFWIRTQGEPPAFQAGQYVTIGVVADGKLVQRPYSVASAPEVVGTQGYELYVRLVDGGAFTPLLWRLPVGHGLRLTGPKGRFTFDPDDARRHLFISTGTGSAPFLSMIRSRLAGGGLKPRVVLLNGVSYVRDIGYADKLAEWRRTGAYPVEFVPTVSRPRDPANDGWTGRTGRVESSLPEVIDRLDVPREEVVAYLCGNPDMILSAEETLLGLGFPEDAVHKELYWPKGKEPRGLAAADLAAAIDAAEANADQ